MEVQRTNGNDTAISQRWFDNIIEQIRVDADPADCVAHLEEMRIAIGTMSTSDHLLRIVEQLPLEVLFDCLNSSDKAQVDLVVTVLNSLLSVVNVCDVIKRYGVQLGRCLEHPHIGAKNLVLNQLNRATNEIDLLAIICKETPLISAVIGECVKSDDVSLALTAIQFLYNLTRVPVGLETLFSPPILHQIRDTYSAGNDAVKFRINQLIVDVSVKSADELNMVANANLLDDLLEKIRCDDVLVQLTALETVTKLATTNHGYRYLDEHGLLVYLNDMLKDPSTIYPLLLPGYIKFFGSVAQARPEEIFGKYSNAIDLIFQLYYSDDPTIANIALETIGYIASSPSGKSVLSRYDINMRSVMNVIGKIIVSQPAERKVVALNVFANIIRLEVSNQTPELENMTKLWFSHLSEDPAKTLKNVCEKPFGELKLAALVALAAVAEHNWGQQEIRKCPGLVEYLLDRNEESDMNCKAAKYDIVKNIVKSPHSMTVFGDDLCSKFHTYVKQGIIYVPAKTEVALENAS